MLLLGIQLKVHEVSKCTLSLNCLSWEDINIDQITCRLSEPKGFQSCLLNFWGEKQNACSQFKPIWFYSRGTYFFFIQVDKRAQTKCPVWRMFVQLQWRCRHNLFFLKSMQLGWFLQTSGEIKWVAIREQRDPCSCKKPVSSESQTKLEILDCCTTHCHIKHAIQHCCTLK